jgi:hypothetical protein
MLGSIIDERIFQIASIGTKAKISRPLSSIPRLYRLIQQSDAVLGLSKAPGFGSAILSSSKAINSNRKGKSSDHSRPLVRGSRIGGFRGPSYFNVDVIIPASHTLRKSRHQGLRRGRPDIFARFAPVLKSSWVNNKSIEVP